MNLELLQTVDQSYPEHNDGILDSGSEALTCAFNRRGTLLAVGCNDGRIAIWDFMTRSITRMCTAHIHPITSLSWNRSGRKLLSSSTDWNVVLWDVATGEVDLRLRFPSPVLRSQFHPRNTSVFLVCPMKNVPLVLKKQDEDYKHTPLPTDGESELNIVASFDRRGERIVTGSSKGKILIVDSSTLQILKSFKVYSGASTATAVKSIEFARRGSNFLVNSADRVIRVFDIDNIMRSSEEEVEALQRLQDLVNRTQWKKCTFSGDGEFIVAGSYRQHALYIWDRATGSLVKMLTGQKGETLLDVVWHPVRPVILSISTGVVNVWSQAHVELWSAYAPNFKELDENEEYEEKEDEFDIEDEDKVLKGGGLMDGTERNYCDVMAVAPIPAFCSSEEDDEEPLDWLPIAPEVEEPEEPGWGQLEPALNEQPQVKEGKKRPANDEHLDPGTEPPPSKQARTIDIDLPNRWEEYSATDTTTKENKSRVLKMSKKKTGSGKLPPKTDATDSQLQTQEQNQEQIDLPQQTDTTQLALDTDSDLSNPMTGLHAIESTAGGVGGAATEITSCTGGVGGAATESTAGEVGGAVADSTADRVGGAATESTAGRVGEAATENTASGVGRATTDSRAEEVSSGEGSGTDMEAEAEEEHEKPLSTDHSTKLPSTGHSTKLPSTGHSTKLPSTDHSTKLPSTGHSTKLPSTDHSTKLPSTDQSTKLSPTDHIHSTELPSIDHSTNQAIVLSATDHSTKLLSVDQSTELHVMPPTEHIHSTELLSVDQSTELPSIGEVENRELNLNED